MAGAGKTVVLKLLLTWAFWLTKEGRSEDVLVTFCAPTQELMKRTRAELEGGLPKQGPAAEKFLWAFGFDRARGVSLLAERLQRLVCHGADSAGTITNQLGWMIDRLLEQMANMKELISSDSTLASDEKNFG